MMNNNNNCILSVAQMTRADQLTIADLHKQGRGGADLMEEAGRSVSREIIKNCSGSKALILCGPGNNGGDGFVIARHLKDAAWTVQVALLGAIDNLQGDAYHMAKLWDGDIEALTADIVADQDVIVDALFGTGLSKDISGKVKDVLEKSNDANASKIAVDIPSGIKGDTGEVLGTAFKADKTVTFCKMKPAHLLYPGRHYCGEITVANIGISDRMVDAVEPDIFLNLPALWQAQLPTIHSDAHKYDKGHAVVVSGDLARTGACRLAATAALRIGAGLVSVSSPEDALVVHAAHLTSVMIRRREQLSDDLSDERLNVWCIGPAAGLTIETKQNVLSIINAGKNAVFDADALSVFEDNPRQLYDAIQSRVNEQYVLTPHAGEFGRLFPYLKKLDKITAAQNAAKLSGAIVIYKGADTVITSPDGRTNISSNAPPSLATAGSGDVLAGLVTGLMAQNMPAFEAACAAVWVHGECANEFGAGLISEDLQCLIPRVLKRLLLAVN